MTNTSSVRVRIPPSPTGLFHVGNARTMLFNALFAKKEQGVVVLRFEDTDSTRSTKEFEADILSGLSWLGISWDEGPFYQSERTALYQQAAEMLLESGKAYRCFCTPETLKTAREAADTAHRPFQYPKTCRALSAEESTRRSASEPFVLRLQVNETEPLVVHDLVRGDVSFAPDAIDDFVISKGMEMPLYHLAVVVDDADMRISHVIRGEDHLSNTPKHLLLQRALGLPTPLYAHLPLLLNEKRAKLSKRDPHNETSVTAYRKKGYLPEALVNAFALLGWSPKNDEEFFSFNELAAIFSLDHVQKSGGVFSEKKLRSFNKHYIQQKSVAGLVRYVVEEHLFPNVNTSIVQKVIVIEKDRIELLSDMEETLVSLSSPVRIENAQRLVWKESTVEETRNVLSLFLESMIQQSHGFTDVVWESTEKSLSELQKLLLAYADASGMDRGVVLWPIRYALCGKEKSTGPAELIWALGKEETLTRIKSAVQLLHEA